MQDELRPLAPEALERLPVFPLPRVVFFPGSVLPLHLFEPRYREMMEHCIDGPMAMAVTMLAPGWEDEYDSNPPIHELAGAGRIVEHRRRPDGRFDLLLAGVHRVRLEELPDEEGRHFRMAKATVLPDRVPEAVGRALPSVLATASSVVTLIRERYPDFTLDVGAGTPPGLVADRIADRLVSEPEARQRLLEALDVKVRLHHVADELVDLLAHLRAEGFGGALN